MSLSCSRGGLHGVYEMDFPTALKSSIEKPKTPTLELRKDGTFEVTIDGESLSGTFAESDGSLQFTIKSAAGERTFQGTYSAEDKTVRLLGMTFRKKE